MKLTQKNATVVLFTLTLMLTATMAASVFSAPVNGQTTPSIIIDKGAAYTNSTTLALTLSSANAVQMRFSTDNSSWSDWVNYATSSNFNATLGDGNYTIFVQFQDSINTITTANSSIVVDTTPPDIVPYADWYSTDYRTVYFDASESTDNIGIANYTWNFGDGNITSGMTVIHAYAAAGNYTVTLTVTDYALNNATLPFSVAIPDLNAIPTPAPTPYPTITIPPTTYPTSTPTATSQPTTFALDSTWTLAIIAVAVIVVVGIAVILMLKRSPKTVPPAP